MPLESTIQTNIMKWLKTLPECHAIVYTAQKRGYRGMTDILGCYKGRSFFIEVKQPGEVSDILQQAVQRKWRKAGAIVGEATNLAEAKALLYPLLASLDSESCAARQSRDLRSADNGTILANVHCVGCLGAIPPKEGRTLCS